MVEEVYKNGTFKPSEFHHLLSSTSFSRLKLPEVCYRLGHLPLSRSPDQRPFVKSIELAVDHHDAHQQHYLRRAAVTGIW